MPAKTQEQKIELSAVSIEKTQRLMKQAFTKTLLEYPNIDITVDQWVIMQILSQNGALSQSDLGRECQKDAPTITIIVDRLMSKNYVAKADNPNDGRKKMIYLTKAGLNIVNKVMPIVYKFRSNCYQGVHEQELKTLDKILKKITTNLSQPQPLKS